MRNPRKFFAGLGALLLIASIHVSVSAQDGKNRIANVSASGSSVRWDVAGPYAGATLTVSAPDGRIFTRNYQARSVPELNVADLDGGKLADGVYTYELRLTPALSKSAKDTLRASRGKDDDSEATRAARKVAAPGLAQSGAFTVLNGAIIVEGAAQEPGAKVATARPLQSSGSVTRVAMSKLYQHHRAAMAMAMPDFVIADDLIVQGSACVGIDCINGEDFGFDTIRVKENNTRIQFDDTSVTAGFPTNNWQIRANSSASGGASFLAFVDQGATGTSETGTILFQVDAGAPANSIKVASTGRVGFRTATPVLDLHINTSNTPAIRLEQNSSGGFTAQTWDVAGNEANFFIRDVTAGSRLPVRIRPGAPTSSVDIAANGNVGMGTASPASRLDVKQSEDSFIGGLHLRKSGVSNDTWAIATGADSNLYMGFANSASGANEAADFTIFPLVVRMDSRVGINTASPDQTLSVNGDASKVGGGTWQIFSDERLKNIKGRFTAGLNAVMQLQPLRYEIRKDNALGLKSEGEHVGFGAQELQKIIPEAVTSNADGYLMVNNDPVIWAMLNAIKEQQKQIEDLKKQVEELRTAAATKPE